jgi:hypothetical protein
MGAGRRAQARSKKKKIPRLAPQKWMYSQISLRRCVDDLSISTVIMTVIRVVASRVILSMA